MSLRDQIEETLRAWDTYEVARGAPAVIDYDCFPSTQEIQPATSRLAVYRQLSELRQAARDHDDANLGIGLDAHLAYLRALMGERAPLDVYVRATQGCAAAGWSEDYVLARGELARQHLDVVGISWGAQTETELQEYEGKLEAEAAPEAIQQEAAELEPLVRHATGAEAPYRLSIETTTVDAYWSYWLDGAGQDVRLRLNLRNARLTHVRARQFALHEVLGHALQSANMAARCRVEAVPWVRLLSVHAPHQVLLEGLAQALPLFVAADDDALVARVRLDHYLQLVRAELHVAINAGSSVDDCAAHAHARVPFWSEEEIANLLTDRSTDPLLRSYLWSYPAGLDWFVALTDADPTVAQEVLHAAYRAPLTPHDLTARWPAGPTIGGTGCAVGLRQLALS